MLETLAFGAEEADFSSGCSRMMVVMTSQASAGLSLCVLVNGEVRRTSARTLAELVAEAGFVAARIATAVNGDFVAERARSARRLAEGDRVEIVAPRQGG